MKVLRLLEYDGGPEFLKISLSNRGVKETMSIHGGIIKEAFIGGVFDYIVPDVISEEKPEEVPEIEHHFFDNGSHEIIVNGRSSGIYGYNAIATFKMDDGSIIVGLTGYHEGMPAFPDAQKLYVVKEFDGEEL